jgi:hypothetical protein
MIRRSVTFVLFLTVYVCYGQDPLGEASLPTPTETGFHSIVLPPTMVGLMNVHKTNLRLYNSQQQETPYLYEEENPIQYSQAYRPYQVLSKVSKKKCCTTVMVKNQDQQPINNFLLRIKNTAITKRASLFGSDDQTQWFGIKENFSIYPEMNNTTTAQMKVVAFPLSNYTFYKLVLDDSTAAPIQMLDMGYYETTSTEGHYYSLPIDSLWHETIDKQTHVYIHFNAPQEIDRITMVMDGAAYFLRRATLSKRVMKFHKGDSLLESQPLHFFEISSRHPSLLEFENSEDTRGTDFVITIQNEDNPPLNLNAVEAFQRKRYLTAWLSVNESYTLRIESPTMTAPHYDLHHFKDSIPTQRTQLIPLDFQPFQKPAEVLTPTIFTTKHFIWATIIIVGMLLTYTAVRMARELGSKAE